MKIIVVQVLAVEEDSEGGQFCKKWADLMRRNMDLVKQKDTELTFRFPTWGSRGLDAFLFSHLHHLNDKSTFHAIVQAEKEGYDAALITCYFDPMLRDIRQAVDIPVVSLCESSLLVAAMIGAKFGIVSIGPETNYDYEENIAKYGLKERAVPIRPVPETTDEQPEALIDAHRAIESFKKVARGLIADGAEIVIPVCGLMSPALRLAPGAEKEYPNGLTEVDGVPVMDVLGATVKMAETLVSLKQSGSSWISRKASIAQATPKAKELAAEVLDRGDLVFWDY
jgi:allantoin racemase